MEFNTTPDPSTEMVPEGNAMSPPPPPPDQEYASASLKSADERKRSLAQTIASQVAQGARVESQSDFQAVLVRGHRPNHTLHFIIGLLTLGVWWLVWIAIAIFGGEKRSMVTVDEYGNVAVQSL